MQKDKKLIENTISILNDGGIIGFPSDTVYGMGCDAYNSKAINRIYELKRRKGRKKPLILFIKDISELPEYVKASVVGLELAEAFWPGALTIIFKAKSRCPIHGPKATVGVRIPVAEPILSILRQYPNPLATTSANVESIPPPITHSELNIKLDFVIPGKSGNVPSTIIDITSYPPVILREGKISRAEIESVIGEIKNHSN